MTLNLGPHPEPPRSTAYYYADIERLKQKNQTHVATEEPRNPEELSEYVVSSEVANEGPKVEIPPLRDRPYVPEYTTPEACRVPEETYSTAGTFPMPEPKEKEPLLAELELVGRLPLTQLESGPGVRRSRSWYLCCPNVADEEISRESSWRYSSLRPVTAPPMGRNGMSFVVTTQSSGHDTNTLRCERDALARALAAERARAAAAARAHDARLAELHGVIAELVRRRAADKQARAIPEEEVSDECESTTQPAGELDNDADRSRTDQNDSSSLVSPAELPTPQDPKLEAQTDENFKHEVQVRIEKPVEVSLSEGQAGDNCDTSLDLSARDSDVCLSTARCCQYGAHELSADSCERDHGSSEGARVYAASPGRCESRQAKIASRVRLRKTDDGELNHSSNDETWCAEAAERLARDVCAQAELREALAAAAHGGSALWRARAARLEADARVLRLALARAADTAHRLSMACAAQESASVGVCLALRAADRALEAYDVLLALAETAHAQPQQRAAAESVAKQLLRRLDDEQHSAAIGEPLLSPGPWLQHDAQPSAAHAWSAQCEARLRAHAARLKADTVALRPGGQPPALFSYHDVDEDDAPKSGDASMVEMEAAVMMQEALAEREAREAARAAGVNDTRDAHRDHKSNSTRSRRRRERHWLETQASETDL